MRPREDATRSEACASEPTFAQEDSRGRRGQTDFALVRIVGKAVASPRGFEPLTFGLGNRLWDDS